MTDMATILERVRKLHAKAESCRDIGSIAEAETFADAVARLLEAHKLDMGAVEIAAQDIDDPMGDSYVDLEAFGIDRKSRRETWAVFLANGIAHAHYCQLFTGGGNSVAFVGRKSDRAIAEYMFATLYRAGVRMADAADREHRKERRGIEQEQGWISPERGYRASWLVGFASSIARRYRYSHVAQGDALVRARHESLTYLRNMPGMRTGRSIQARPGNGAGLDAGKAAGAGMNLKANGVGGGASDSRMRAIGAGV